MCVTDLTQTEWNKIMQTKQDKQTLSRSIMQQERATAAVGLRSYLNKLCSLASESSNFTLSLSLGNDRHVVSRGSVSPIMSPSPVSRAGLRSPTLMPVSAPPFSSLRYWCWEVEIFKIGLTFWSLFVFTILSIYFNLGCIKLKKIFNLTTQLRLM